MKDYYTEYQNYKSDATFNTQQSYEDWLEKELKKSKQGNNVALGLIFGIIVMLILAYIATEIWPDIFCC